MSSSPEGRFIVSTGSFGASLVGLVMGVFGSLGTFFASVPMLVIALTLSGLMFPWIQYHDEAFETGEQFMRGEVYPVWRDTVRPIWNQIRRLVNSLSCWISGANWWAYGIVQDVIFPTVRDCGPGTFFANVGEFILAVMNDFVVDYFIAQKFYDGPADFTNICDKWIALWNSWMDMYSCACMDLALILRSLPIIPSLWFSEQWADPQTWCAISNFVNALMEILSIVLTLVSQTLMAILSLISPQSPYAQVNFTRPNFYNAAEFICRGLNCLGRSIENAIQRFWDNYIPWPFDFTNYISVLDGFLCFVVKTVNWVLTFFINIDKIINFPTDPFWETDMKPLTIENINLVGPPSNWDPVFSPMPPAPTQFVMTNYYLDTANPFTPAGGPNPVYQKLRLTEGACIFIDRTICDPENMSTACFSQSAANLLRGLDFCCLTNTVTVLVIDLVTSMIEFTYHLTSGADRFFLFIDNQPFTTVLVDSITPLARCIVSILTLIPVVGFALQNLIVEVVCFLAAVIDFFWRTIIGLATLPYFLIEMPGTDNFLTMTGRGISQWEALFDKLIAEIPTSALNSLCILLNTGFPIPPIPCGSCDLTGFIPLPPQKRGMYGPQERGPPKRRFYNPDTGKMDSPWTLAAETMGWQNPESAFLVTPLIHYSNYTLNPFELGKMITINSKALSQKGVLPFPDHASIDKFFDGRKDYMLGWWNDMKTCKDLKKEEAKLRESRPHLWKYYKQQGKYDCKEGETYAQSRERRMGLLQDVTYNTHALKRKSEDYVEHAEKWMNGELETPMQFDSHTVPPGNETHDMHERLTLYPTVPPILSCGPPNPPCFDLCCVFRSVTKTFAHTLQALGRFFNGFVQYERTRYGSQGDFPYFTGEFCEPQFNRDCFESDLVKLILLFFENFTCICRFLNLVIPVTPENPRPDICCAIQRVSEFFACFLTVIINAITALAMGASDGFAYYVEGYFFNDVSTLFDVVLEVVFCACVLIRAVFPLNYIPGLREAVRFDPCCLPSALAITLVEVVRFLTLTVISLATITINDEAFCFFRLDTTKGCSGTLDGIGIVQRFDAIKNSFLPVSDSGFPGSCKDNCKKDQSRNGVVPCICEILNTIIPWRTDPGSPVSCELPNLNCQTVDFCCPFVQLGFALEFAVTFLSRLTVALWQPWTPLPEFAIHYMFCEEEVADPTVCGTGTTGSCGYVGAMQPEPTCECGTFSCGKINPIIQALANPSEGLIARCLCELFKLLDDLLVMVFESVGSGWQRCFCGKPNGTLLSGPLVAEQLLRAVVGFLRKFPLPCYWQPAGRTYTAIQPPGMPPMTAACLIGVTPNCVCLFEKVPLQEISDSWLYSFLGPTVEAICISVGNLMCFINAIFFIDGRCLPIGSRFMGSTIRWGLELALRVVAAIEGFIRQFTDPIPTCVGSDPMCDAMNTGTYNGVSAAPLGRILTSLFTWFVDSLIGDSVVACSRICPTDSFFKDGIGTCDCYGLSPKTAATALGGGPVYVQELNVSSPFGYYQCTYTNQAINGNVAWWESTLGENGVMGLGAAFPICQSINDVAPGSAQYPGNCQRYGLCRPDSLPACQVPADAGQDVEAFNQEGPIDGQFNGIIRYIACAIDFGTNTSVGSGIARPILVFNSIIWQLYGGVMRFVAAWLIFLLSFFNLGGGCACHDYTDPEQCYEGTCGEIRHTRGTGLAVGFCYPCPDVNGMCGNKPDFPFFCEKHCPQFKNCTNPAVAQQECVAHLNEYSRSENWPGGSTAASLCDGTWEEDKINDICSSSFLQNIYGGLEGCKNTFVRRYITGWNTQSSCAKPYCQCGGGGIVNFPGIGTRGRTTGSTVPRGPKVLCSFLTLLGNLVEVFNAFAAIFSTPIIIPDSKRDLSNIRSQEDFVRSYRRAPTRENRTAFLKRVGLLKIYTGPSEDEFGNNLLKHAKSLEKLTRAMDDIKHHTEELKKRDDPSAPYEHTEKLTDAYESMYELLLNPSARSEPYRYNDESQETDELKKFYRRTSTGHTIQEHAHTSDGHSGKVPSGPEQFLLALWDYDMSDCIDDPVSCICRNFHMPDHCSWDPEFGTIPATLHGPTARRKYARQHDKKWVARHTYNGTFVAPKQKRDSVIKKWARRKREILSFTSPHGVGGGLKKREAEPEPFEDPHLPEDYNMYNNGDDQVYPEEVMQVLTESFVGQTECDHTVCGCALDDWDTMNHETKEMWAQCVNKRIQGERMNQMSWGLLDEDTMYHSQAPLLAFEKLTSRWKHSQTGLTLEARKRHAKKKSKTDTLFPDLGKILKERKVAGRKYLKEVQHFDPASPILEAVVEMDQIYMKWKTGYYEFLVNETYRTIRDGDWHWPTTHEAVDEIRFASHNLRNTMWNQPYRELWDSTAEAAGHAYRAARYVLAERGAVNSVKDLTHAAKDHFKRKAEQNRPRREMLWKRFYSTPLYNWWNMPATENKGIMTPFLRHVQTSIQNYRTNWKDSPLNFWNMDKHLQGKVERVVDSWNNPPWKSHQLENWERVGRLYYGLHDKIWPYQLSPEIRERFLLGGNCRVIDETVELTIRVADYCTNEFMPNLNFKKRAWFQGYLNGTSPFRPNTFYSNRNRHRYNLEPSQRDPDAWIRPKMKPLNKTREQLRRELRAKVDKNVYKRAMMANPSYTGPGGWNFYNWFYDFIEMLVNYMFSTDFDGWLDQARQWINNPNTEESDYPNVGLRYWLLFMIRCEFPDNLNCSKGVGLEPAIIWVTVGVLGAFLVGAFIFPPLLWPFYIVAAPWIWLILVGVIGLHYSPRCVFLTPSITGLSVALPFCLADEVTAFVDKYVTDCYVPLIIPACMISGDECPVDPNQFIDIVNCQAVGISDGLQHVLFISWKAFGQWALDLFLWFSQVWSWLIPGLPSYMMRTIDSFTMASDSMQCRQWWCFGLTAPAIALPLLLGALFLVLLGFVIPLLISTLLSGWYWFETTPHAQGLPGYDGNWETDDGIDGPADIYAIPSAPPEADLTPENVQQWIRSARRA